MTHFPSCHTEPPCNLLYQLCAVLPKIGGQSVNKSKIAITKTKNEIFYFFSSFYIDFFANLCYTNIALLYAI